MKLIRNTGIVAIGVLAMLIGDAPPEASFRLQIANEAHAILGVWRRTARRVAVVETAAVATTAAAATAGAAAAAQSSAAAAQKEAAAAQAAAAKPPAPAATPPQPVVAGATLPIGTVAAALPSGCTPTPVGGIEYYYCQGNFYRAMFQGNTLVYVTAQPK